MRTAEMTDRQTDRATERHDEADRNFSQFCKCV